MGEQCMYDLDRSSQLGYGHRTYATGHRVDDVLVLEPSRGVAAIFLFVVVLQVTSAALAAAQPVLEHGLERVPVVQEEERGKGDEHDGQAAAEAGEHSRHRRLAVTSEARRDVDGEKALAAQPFGEVALGRRRLH